MKTYNFFCVFPSVKQFFFLFKERINEENEKKIKEIETSWQNQVATLRLNLDLVKEQMERESQQKIQNLIEQHRTELGK